jgi:hypothetical protein
MGQAVDYLAANPVFGVAAYVAWLAVVALAGGLAGVWLYDCWVACRRARHSSEPDVADESGEGPIAVP